MVGHNDISSDFLQSFNLPHICDSAVNSNNKRDMFFAHFVHHFYIQTVALAFPKRNMHVGFYSKLAQDADQNNGSANPVCIIITVNHYIFFSNNRFHNPFHRLIHSGQKKRVVDIFSVIRTEKFINFFLCYDSSIV